MDNVKKKTTLCTDEQKVKRYFLLAEALKKTAKLSVSLLGNVADHDDLATTVGITAGVIGANSCTSCTQKTCRVELLTSFFDSEDWKKSTKLRTLLCFELFNGASGKYNVM